MGPYKVWNIGKYEQEEEPSNRARELSNENDLALRDEDQWGSSSYHVVHEEPLV
ncbi:591_t:CDS:2 [Scutellospora calospora]|uniref:591_t:CDS:1 n=1 Tax=Scutellospora calospora TaxID=85575 RepID=A0ACA9JWQ2_9GLOM|nr:591_t:CDS:2 [Scutellospora calospora]